MSKLSSISEAVNWLENNAQITMLFLWIFNLTDGLSFEIFNQTKINKPVIFTTAFDEYAVDAFKVNSIDYVLKPITFTDISKAMSKLKTMQTMFSSEKVMDVAKMVEKKKIKDRFLVRLGNHIHSIKTNEIALFYAEGRTVYLVTNANKKYILDFKLEDLNSVLNQTEFFRVNRSFIVNINSIDDVIVYSNSRLKVIPKVKVLIKKL